MTILIVLLTLIFAALVAIAIIAYRAVKLLVVLMGHADRLFFPAAEMLLRRHRLNNED